MLVLHVDKRLIAFNEQSGEFKYSEAGVLHLEHSLASISKWESITRKPYFVKKSLTEEETMIYIECMTLNDPDPSIYNGLTPEHYAMISSYCEQAMTATTFSDIPGKAKNVNRGEVTTSDTIYFQMFTYGIPLECENWHINRLLTLIRVFGVKNEDPKKMSRTDMYNQQIANKEKYDKMMEEKDAKI